MESLPIILTRSAGLCRKRWKAVILGIPVICAGNYLSAVLIHSLQGLYLGKFSVAQALVPHLRDFAGLIIVPIFLISLIAEAKILGWDKSSISRLFVSPTPSSRTDLFYLFLAISNLQLAFGLIFTFGLGYFAEFTIQRELRWSLLSSSPLAIQAVVQLFLGSFIFYVQHWLQHSRLLWEFHKVHHAAETMTLANNYRGHPFVYFIRPVLEVIPGAMLGIHPSILAANFLLTGTVILWQHTDAKWNLPWIERYIFFGADDHRIHHSTSVEHQNKNLGYLIFWDWLFGTLHRAEARQVEIGIDDISHNRGRPFQEMMQIYFRIFSWGKGKEEVLVADAPSVATRQKRSS